MLDLQEFIDLLIIRFRNIEPLKGGGSVVTPTDLKHEIQIITLPDDIFEKFKDFIELHSLGNLIDPDTGVQYRMNRAFFDQKKHHINREFFRKLGKLSDQDISKMVTLLVHVDTAEGAPKYPRLSFHKARHHHRSQHSVGDWCIRHKSKQVAWTEMKAVRPTLPFFLPNEDIVNPDKWKVWKLRKGFSTASWNMVLSHVEAKFYSTRLQNLGKCKTAKELKDRFPTVEDFFRNFLLMKTKHREFTKEFSLRTYNSKSLSLSPQWSSEGATGEVSLGLFDLRDTAYALCKGEDSPRLFMNDIMARIALLSNPAYTDPTVWVWIVNGPAKKLDKLKTQIQFHFANYTMSTSVYRLARAEKLYNMPFPDKVANDVHIIFLFKKDDRGNVFINSNKLEIRAPDVPYYMDSGHYNEAKWMAKESELRMEFYIDLIRTYCKKGDSTLGIFCGSKFIVASLVSINSFV